MTTLYDYETLQKENEKLHSIIVEIQEVLTKVEWVSNADYFEGDIWEECPYCEGTPEHEPTCKLQSLLIKTKEMIK